MSDRPIICRDGAVLSGTDVGSGPAVLFQHGLGGDERQVAEVFPDDAGFRRLTLECRGHGGSGLGPADSLSLATFTADALAFLDQRDVHRFVAGGISMGAAMALRLAVTAPERVGALVLARPAWMTEPAPANLRFYAEAGALLSKQGGAVAKHNFASSRSGRLLAEEAPDNFASLSGFFSPERPAWTGRLLCAIAGDGPGITDREVRSIAVPTLVIGHARDLAHPLAYATALAGMIAGAEIVEVPPKANDLAAYRRGFREALLRFLRLLPSPL